MNRDLALCPKENQNFYHFSERGNAISPRGSAIFTNALDLLWTPLPLVNPEKRHMKHFEEFASALEKKIRRQIKEEMQVDSQTQASSASAAFVREELPLGYAWLLGQSGVFAQTSKAPVNRGRTAYGVRQKPALPHKMSPDQTDAKEIFRLFGVLLSPAFQRQELKKAWRSVAKSTHPDHGGTASDFRKALSAYQILLSIF